MIKNQMVSVIIPTYNRGFIIFRAIKSVLCQTYQDFEIIVVDDASTDTTEDIVLSFNDDRIFFYRHKERRGGGAARNMGIRLANGSYIAFLDSDDEWLPKKLELQIAFFLKEKNRIGIVDCLSTYGMDDETGVTRLFTRDKPQGNVYLQLLNNKWLGSPTSFLMVDRDMLLQEGILFDESLPAFQEYDLKLRLSCITNFAFIEEPLGIQHYHTKQISQDFNARINGINLFLKKWEDEIIKYFDYKTFKGIYNKYIELIYIDEALKQITQGNRINSLHYIIKCIKLTGSLSLKNTVKLMVAFCLGGTAYQMFLRMLKDLRTWSALHS